MNEHDEFWYSLIGMTHEEIMVKWDKWRVMITDGVGGSLPRDEFERLLDLIKEAVEELD